MKLALALAIALAATSAGGAQSPRATPALSLTDALTLLDDWQLEDAKAAAEQFLVEDPQNPEVLYLAARVQHARGEHLSALSLVRAAAAAGSRDADGFLPLVESSARYAAHFQTLPTDHFDIRYLNKDEVVAVYAAPVLEAAYNNIGGDLELLPAERGEKIIVEIYPDARGLSGATGLTIREIETSGTIAVCKFHRLMITSPLATADGYGWADTLAHEFVHLIVSKKSKNTIPIWLHEGIAKYYESRWRGVAGDALGPYSEKLLADATRKKKYITFQQMHPSMAKLPSQEDAALAFAEVFTTIEFLIKEHGKGSVPKVLALSATGVDLEPALKRVYGMGLGGIETAWKRYLKSRPFKEVAGAKPKPIRLATDESQANEPRPLETMKDREVHDYARLGELLALRGHAKAAIVEYERAYSRAGMSYSTLVYRLARAYAEGDRATDALALLDKALLAHPDDGDCHLLAGRLRLRQNDLEGARKHFEAVRLSNPFNPEIHAALKQLYEQRGDRALAEREQHFLEITKKARPTRTYELPTPRAGEARLNLVVAPFSKVQVDGELVAAPVWDYAVSVGEHTIAYSGGKTKKFTVAAGALETIVLD
jgi:tetratricopeptide (TPR) repeat protein